MGKWRYTGQQNKRKAEQKKRDMLETLILLIYSYEPSGGSPSVSFCPACALQNDDVMRTHTYRVSIPFGIGGHSEMQ